MIQMGWPGQAVLIITTYCQVIICWLTSLLTKYIKNELIKLVQKTHASLKAALLHQKPFDFFFPAVKRHSHLAQMAPLLLSRHLAEGLEVLGLYLHVLAGNQKVVIVGVVHLHQGTSREQSELLNLVLLVLLHHLQGLVHCPPRLLILTSALRVLHPISGTILFGSLLHTIALVVVLKFVLLLNRQVKHLPQRLRSLHSLHLQAALHFLRTIFQFEILKLFEAFREVPTAHEGTLNQRTLVVRSGLAKAAFH